MSTYLRLFLGFFLSVFLFVSCNYKKSLTAADIKLSDYYADNMVFEQGKPILIRGKAKAFTTLAVRLENYYKLIEVPENGSWECTFPPTRTRGSFNIYIEGLETTIVLKNVMTGRLFVLAGSGCIPENLRNSRRYSLPISEEQNRKVRLFIPSLYIKNHSQQELLSGIWKVNCFDSIPESELYATMLASELSKKLDLPVGVINLIHPKYKPDFWISQFDDSLSWSSQETDSTLYGLNLASLGFNPLVDSFQLGLENSFTSKWFPEFNWKTFSLPIPFSEHLTDPYGSFWLIKKIYLSENNSNSHFVLDIGNVLGKAQFYFNNTLLYQQEIEGVKKNIQIPHSVINQGLNILAIRLAATDTLNAIYNSPYTAFNQDTSYFYGVSDEWKVKNLSEFSDDMKLESTGSSCFNIFLNSLKSLPISAFIWFDNQEYHVLENDYAKMINTLYNEPKAIFNKDLQSFLVQIPKPDHFDSINHEANIFTQQYIQFQNSIRKGIHIISGPNMPFQTDRSISFYQDLVINTNFVLKEKGVF